MVQDFSVGGTVLFLKEKSGCVYSLECKNQVVYTHENVKVAGMRYTSRIIVSMLYLFTPTAISILT
jgi:hypothetical protein